MKADKIFSTLGKGFINITDKEFLYGPFGLLFLRNIENNWWKHCVISTKYNVYPSKISEVSKTLEYLRDTNNDNQPFGLALIENVEHDRKQSQVLGLSLPTICKTMRVMTFGEKISAKDLFYKIHRERKAWWRKFSSNPSRFIVENSKRNENCDIMDIKARFPSEDLTVEVISFGKAEYYLQKMNIGNIGNSYVVEHATSLELAFVALLCDGYAEDGESLHIHPQLAPYKALIAVDASNGNEELIQLATYLNNLLKVNCVNTIISSNNKSAQILRVPYVILIDNESLKNGIVQVRSQLTTVSEKVHITDLVKYVEAYCS